VGINFSGNPALAIPIKMPARGEVIPVTSLRLIIMVLLMTCVMSHAQYVQQLMARGDISDLVFNPDEALKDYLPAEKLEPTNVPLLLRIARQYRHLMSDAKTNPMKLKLGGIALDYALRAASLAPNDSEAQLSPAITYGKMLPVQTSKQQYDESSLIKRSADKALKLDPLNDNAWHVLGRWHQGLASVGSIKRAIGSIVYGSLPASTYQDAITCFDKAIAINPNRLRHHIEMGKTYALMGSNIAARRYLEKGIGMANTEKDDPEMKTRGREVLATLPKAP
jgi:tetratricopeptide (TPR) repeat protein